MLFINPVVSAILLTFSGPGFEVPLINTIALIPLFYSLNRYKDRWLSLTLTFGLIYYFINLFWITDAVNFFGDTNIFVGMLLTLLLAAYLSFYYVIFGYIFIKTDSKITIATTFAILELIKSFFMTGFPWLNLGLTFIGYKPILINAALIGEIGLSFIVILFNLIILDFLKSWRKGVILFLIFFIASHFYYFMKDTKVVGEMISFTLVQPSYDHRKKWDLYERDMVVSRVMELTEKGVKSEADIVVLPESAFPLYIQNENWLIGRLKSLSYVKPLIVGNIRYEIDGDKFKPYNSNFYINKGEISFYDKMHLVPFGEFFPFKVLTSGIQKYFFGSDQDFERGENVVLFNYKDIKIGNLICYEDAFFELSIKNVREGSYIFVVTTNDSWFGKYYGRDQHFALNIIRAIETGRSFLVSSQSGISGCIEPYGKVIKTFGIDEIGILNCSLPINKQLTLFTRISYWWLLGLIIIVLIVERRRFKKRL